MWYLVLTDECRWYMGSHNTWERKIFALYNDSNKSPIILLTSPFGVAYKCSLGLSKGNKNGIRAYPNYKCRTQAMLPTMDWLDKNIKNLKWEIVIPRIKWGVYVMYGFPYFLKRKNSCSL